MVNIRVIQPDGDEQIWEADTTPEREVLERIVGEDIQFLIVQYKNKPTYMVVPYFNRSMMPINHAATRIYHAQRRDAISSEIGRMAFGDPRGWKPIHGTAVVIEDMDSDNE